MITRTSCEVEGTFYNHFLSQFIIIDTIMEAQRLNGWWAGLQLSGPGSSPAQDYCGVFSGNQGV